MFIPNGLELVRTQHSQDLKQPVHSQDFTFPTLWVWAQPRAEFCACGAARLPLEGTGPRSPELSPEPRGDLPVALRVLERFGADLGLPQERRVRRSRRDTSVGFEQSLYGEGRSS